MLTKLQPPDPQPANDNAGLLRLRNGEFAIVDRELLPELQRYKWFLKKSKAVYYVVRKERTPWGTRLIKLHRQIMNCPADKQVHHVNHNPKDNRRVNLKNVDPADHRRMADWGQ